MGGFVKIIGPDTLFFGVHDMASCSTYLRDFGLIAVNETESGIDFEALDGSGIKLRHADDPALPPPLPTGSLLRETVYGVADSETLRAIQDEVAKDRLVETRGDGTIAFVDDAGFHLRFQVTIRRPIFPAAESVNAPGVSRKRGVNELGINPTADLTPLTLSHIVYFVPDTAKVEAFYADRLGFRTVDRFVGVGPFMQPGGNPDHHTLFMIQTPPHMLGLEHIAFHMTGPTAVMSAGTNFVNKGYQSFWGPGRHKLGSNWFWYFNSPLGIHVEYDADMDTHDGSWLPRVVEMGAEHSQAFLFAIREKWAPSAPPPGADHPVREMEHSGLR